MKASACVLLAWSVLTAGCGCPAQSEHPAPEGLTAADDPAASPVEKPAVKPSVAKPPSDKLPADGKPAKPPEGKQPPEKPKPAPKDSGPIYGLPLEYHFKVPEVPARIRGPTLKRPVEKPETPSGRSGLGQTGA